MGIVFKNFGVDTTVYNKNELIAANLILISLLLLSAFFALFMCREPVVGIIEGNIEIYCPFIRILGAFTITGIYLLFLVSAFLLHKNTVKLLLAASCSGIIGGSIFFIGFAFFKDIRAVADFIHYYKPGINFFDRLACFGNYVKICYLQFLPPALLLFVVNIIRLSMRGKSLSENEKNSGLYGTAKFADENYLKEKGFFSTKKSIFGKDGKNHFLSYEICNRTIISKPGGGKTVGITIPALLSENRPVFCHDPKGELWAVTSRYRVEKFRRKIITIDPFGVTMQKGFRETKKHLKKELNISYINPLKYIPEDKSFRDRYITSLVDAIVQNSKDSDKNDVTAHFLDTTKTIITGLIERIIEQKNSSAGLLDVYRMLNLSEEDIKESLEEMYASENIKQTAAASAILSAGSNERGSMLNTARRQLAWLSDFNLQRSFSENNCDLNGFVDGNTDIYIIMPEDQIRPQARVIRMLFSITQSLIIQKDRQDLSKKKYLFLMDELGQLGYTPAMESSIEILRGRNCIFWSVFQSYSQIQQYRKADLFISANMLQLFACATPEIMDIIQKLGGTQTKLVERTNYTKSSSTAKGSLDRGSTSTSDGSSVVDVRTDLIHFNEIRELPKDEQYVFIDNKKPIKCKKLFYYCDSYFNGYDKNPLETR